MAEIERGVPQSPEKQDAVQILGNLDSTEKNKLREELVKISGASDKRTEERLKSQLAFKCIELGIDIQGKDPYETLLAAFGLEESVKKTKQETIKDELELIMSMAEPSIQSIKRNPELKDILLHTLQNYEEKLKGYDKVMKEINVRADLTNSGRIAYEKDIAEKREMQRQELDTVAKKLNIPVSGEKTYEVLKRIREIIEK